MSSCPYTFGDVTHVQNILRHRVPGRWLVDSFPATRQKSTFVCEAGGEVEWFRGFIAKGKVFSEREEEEEESEEEEEEEGAREEDKESERERGRE